MIPDRRFLSFLMVGALNTAFGYSCFSLLVFTGIHRSLALFLTTVLGIMFNFKTTGRLVFRSDDNSRIIRFIAVYGVVYLINLAVLEVLVRIGISVYLAGALLLLPSAAITFLLQRSFVFSHD
jgi:putative flippase GtrA